METPVQCAGRLLGALNELVTEEGMYLRAGSFELAAEIRQRTEPIVNRLVELSTSPGVSAFRDQVAAVVERSARHAGFLQEKMEEFRAEIRRTDQARHRTAQLAPAYVRAPVVTTRRFQAAG
jgi:hypothetical protein